MTEKSNNVAELQAEIDRLKAELAAARPAAGKKKSSAKKDDEDDDIAKLTTDANDQAVKETYRLIRGYSSAVAELYSSGADIVNAFNDEVTRFSRDEERDVTKDLNRLPADLVTGYLRALRKSVEVPGRMAQKFADTYRDA